MPVFISFICASSKLTRSPSMHAYPSYTPHTPTGTKPYASLSQCTTNPSMSSSPNTFTP